MSIIVSRDWETLHEEPSMYVVNIVREFFANAKEAQNNKFFLKGKWVPFYVPSINCIYKLRDIEFDNHYSFCNVLINS
ncbi:hypothetical protein MA16_Dca002945 [Dendrobium catenatum]|uniref:Uncharacterized protein n=1 Tax=Dendrobium catenatum TaxID=906689 RepID=A0A2I0X954_9ASPA|nr:hypothetical protein MA16_Dca002945 [Dendrobium catenatum]